MQELVTPARSASAAAAMLAALGCTTLGPMPATTGVSAVPAARPDVDLQLGPVPGYYLSSSVQADPKGTGVLQLALLLEPDRWISVPGLVGGARIVGTEDTSTFLEPMLGYRVALDDERDLSLAVVGYGTRASGEHKHASYDSTRFGLEGAFDWRATGKDDWLELHLIAAPSVTGLFADGEYCLDAEGKYGIDCGEPPTNLTSASAGGFYPALTAGVAIEIARHRDSAFHGLRLALLGAGGTKPTVVNAEQGSAQAYGAVGLTLAVAVGEK